MAKQLIGTVIQGGGARGPGVFGALDQGINSGKWRQPDQQFFAGTSFGSFAAAGLCMGMAPYDLGKICVNTDFRKLLDNWTMNLIPWNLRKYALLLIQGDLKGVANFIDDIADKYKWTPEKAGDRLIVNSVNLLRNKEYIFCEKRPDWLLDEPNKVVFEGAFSSYGFGDILTRSMALPGLKSKAGYDWGDGGASVNNGPMTYIPRDTKIYYINMGYAGDVEYSDSSQVPKSAVDRVSYMFDFKADDAQDHILSEFPKLQFIDCKLYDMSSLDMNASPAKKQWAIDACYERSRASWEFAK